MDAIAVEAIGDGPVTKTIELLVEDPLDDLGGCLVDGEYAQPVALGGLARVRVRPAIDHGVAVGRSASVVAYMLTGRYAANHSEIEECVKYIRKVPEQEGPRWPTMGAMD